MSQSPSDPFEYQCPGDPAVISRAVHLARLAAYYPPCRLCEHRTDTACFTRRAIRRLAEVHAKAPSPARFDSQGYFHGVLLNELTPEVVRHMAAAFGLLLGRSLDQSSRAKVLLAGDGRRLCAPLITAAAWGLRYAGCHVLDVGCATAEQFPEAFGSSQADGGLLIGNPKKRSHLAGLTFWDRNGRPLSDAELDRLKTLFSDPIDRPTRQFGLLGHIPPSTEQLEN